MNTYSYVGVQSWGPSRCQPTSAVRNTLGKEQALHDLVRPISDEAMREYCDKNYHQILPIIAEKVHQEKVQQEKLKAVKARLNFEEASRHSELGTPSGRRSLKERLGDKEKNVSAHSRDSRHMSYHSSRRDMKSCYQSSHSRETELTSEKHHRKRASSQRTEALSKSKGSTRGHWKSKPKKQKSSVEDDLSQPWQEKCIKDPVEIHNIKQKDWESTEEFVWRYKLECMDVKRAMECMKIFEFMHRITNPELIKRLHDNIPKLVDEMMRVGQKQNFKKESFRNQQRTERKQDRFTLLTKTPKEILALDKGKFKPPPPMTTPVKKETLANSASFMGKWDIPLMSERSNKDSKKGGNLRKRQVASNINDTTMAEDSKTKNYSNFLFEVSNFFSTSRGRGWDGRFRPEVKNQMIPAATPLVGFNGEIIWPLGEARGKEDPGNPIHDPWNAKIPSGWRNSYIAEQQDHPTRVHDGFRTRGATTCHQPSRRRKNSGGNPPEISGINCSDRLYSNKKRTKGAVRMREGTFLGYKVDADGLRVCPDKVEAVLNLPSPKCLKDVQKLNGKLASLSRFLSKSAEKSLPFFKTLKKYTKKSDFQWITEA
ncbi:hypothetical protein Tco_0746802 [Tanacetum coccineum]